MTGNDPVDLRHGDCLDVLKTLDADSIDSIVTDPPYGLSFMGKGWDYQVPSVDIWQECFRVLRPGGHLLAFAGTRTQHRMCVNIEDAGFEIRDMIAWVYGSGFPKSLNVGKALQAIAETGQSSPTAQRKAAMGNDYKPTPLAGTEGYGKTGNFVNKDTGSKAMELTDPLAQQWEGWGTALKPALEPITVARKPLGERTVAANVLEHGTGAINIDGCRVEHVTVDGGNLALNPHLRSHINGGNGGKIIAHEEERRVVTPHALGRWPANLIHDGSDDVTELFGEAQRFFYVPKCSKADRDDGNTHPTVKPTDLMAYLCRLVTPPGGIVLDPFMGSGTTGKAALSEGFQFVGIERDADYFAICESRLNEAQIGLAFAL